MRALVLGLGNSLVADDGFGPRVIEELRGRLPEGVWAEVADQYGLYLLDFLEGFDLAIVVDVLEPGVGEPGQLLKKTIRPTSEAPIAPSPHYISLEDVLAVGMALGLSVPREVVLFAVVAKDITTFGGEMSEELKEMVPRVADMVLEELRARVFGGQ